MSELITKVNIFIDIILIHYCQTLDQPVCNSDRNRGKISPRLFHCI